LIVSLSKHTFTPFHLGLAVQLYHEFGSRGLVDNLNSHGFCASYSEGHLSHTWVYRWWACLKNCPCHRMESVLAIYYLCIDIYVVSTLLYETSTLTDRNNTPFHLGLAVQLYHEFGSRGLVDNLNSHGFCASYSEVRRFLTSVAFLSKYIPSLQKKL
jgi:hypothetical protein